MPATVDNNNHTHFIQLVLAEFKTLHSGNIIHFGVRPLEFAAWQEKISNKIMWQKNEHSGQFFKE
jgi:hypothetical protein